MLPEDICPAEPASDDNWYCEGTLCLDQTDCICGHAPHRSDGVGADSAPANLIEPEAQDGVAIYDRKEAQRQIDLFGDFDPLGTRRFSEAEEMRLTRLRELVAQRFRRPLIYPNDGWRAALSTLKDNCPLFAEVTGLVDRAASLARMTQTPLRLPAILLAGPPGVGKTHYCRMLAETLAIAVHSIACNTNSDAKQLFTGLPTAWRAARMGVLTEAMLHSETASPLIVLDEVDKFRTYSDENPYNALLSVLEPQNSRALLDEYLRVPFDLSHAFFIATANDLTALPSFIADRFLVFAIASPTPEQLLVTGRQILREELDRHGDHFAMPSDTVIARLARSHPRKLKRIVPLALGFTAENGGNTLTIADVEAAEQLAADEALTRPIGFMARLDRKATFGP